MTRKKRSNGTSKMAFSLQTITPAKAKAYLKTNEANRPLAASRWRHYLRQMQDGRWKSEHDTRPIAIDINGDLIDGQHRLYALTQFGRPLPFWVATNCPTESRLVVDKGANRTLSNTLYMEYGLQNANRVASISRLLMVFDGAPVNIRLVEQDVLATLKKYEVAFEWYSQVPKAKYLGTGPIFAPLVWLYRKYPTEVDAFYEALRTGSGLRANAPALKLRDHLMIVDRGTSQAGGLLQSLIVFSAFHAHLGGRTLKAIRPSREAASALRKEMRRAAKTEAWMDVAMNHYQNFRGGRTAPHKRRR